MAFFLYYKRTAAANSQHLPRHAGQKRYFCPVLIATELFITHPVSPRLNPYIGMHIDIASHIEKLLFLHDTLIIPSFGGFTAMRAPAGVDYVGGAVTPPSKTLTFNENLTTDDGILVDDIASANHITAEEARRAIQQFVDQTQLQLNQREIVTLPGVGRLYKNYVQKIQFLPDATNFHAGSYGLPPLQFSPIARSREVIEKPAAAPASNGITSGAAGTSEPVKTTAAPAIPPLPPPPAFINDPYHAPRSSSGQIGTGIGVGLLLCIIAFGVWWWQHNKTNGTEPTLADAQQEQTDSPPASSPLSKITDIAKLGNKEKDATKSEKPRAEKEGDDLNDEVEEAAAKKVEVLRRQNEAPPSTIPPSRVEERQCVLIIATLRDRTNADRLIAKLKGAGYDVYYRQRSGHQVGIQFDYTDPKKIQETKAELIRFTGEKGIFVKQK